MPAIEIKGFEELRRNTEHIRRDVLDRALNAAEDAAAKVVRRAIRDSAPRDSGQLAGNIIIYEGRDRSALTRSPRRRLLVGPQKRKGFYGYFYEKGRAGFDIKARKAKTLHWTKGGDAFHKEAKIGKQPARPWFSVAASAVELAAWEAGKKAFEETLARELGRM